MKISLLQISSTSEILQLHELLKELKQQSLYTVIIVIVCFIVGTYVFKYIVSRSIEQAKSDVTKKDIKEITEKIEQTKSDVTKRDIEEITKKVETIRTEFTKEIEHLKINLQFENTVKATIYTERKDAIIKLYETVQLWYNIIEDHLAAAVEYNKKDLQEAEREMEEHEFKVDTAESKAELYVDDNVFLLLLDDYIKAIGKLQDETINFLIDLDEIPENVFTTDDKFWAEQKRLNDKYQNITQPIRKNIVNLWMKYRKMSMDKILNN